jgi:adenine deaminase
VAPGYRADLAVVSDWQEAYPHVVVKDGGVVARDGQYLVEEPAPSIPSENTVRLGPLSEDDFALPLSGSSCPVIGITEGQIVTQRLNMEVAVEQGRWVFDPERDVLLAASIERHQASGRKGLGLVTGFGFKKHGAIGSSVAHDSHNLVIAGTNAPDMQACAAALADSGGGWVVVVDREVQTQLKLPVAGLLANDPAEEVARKLAELRASVRRLGCPLSDPFGVLSFLALSVIPELRITDRGLFEVLSQQFVTI